MVIDQLSPAYFERLISIDTVSHVFLIRYGNSMGSCFIIDVDKKEYFITAKHVVSGLKEKDTIDIFRGDRWLRLSVRLIGHHINADVSVFSADFRPECINSTLNCGTSVKYSQGVYFLGFPYGMRQDEVARAVNGPYPMAFVKKAILSGIIKDVQFARFILDGNNNPGFSGGPVIYYDEQKHENRVLGIISSYKIDFQDIVADGKVLGGVKSQGNSGIIYASSIEYALDLIKMNPNGYSFNL